MRQILDEMDEVLKTGMADRHTFYQLKYFVVDGEPTPQARLWTCLREIRSRRDALRAIGLEAEESRDRLVILQAKAQKAADLAEDARARHGPRHPDGVIAAAKARIAERRVRVGQERLADLSRRTRCTFEEARFLLELFRQMGGTKSLKDWDDPAVQKEYWNARTEDEFRRRLIAGQGIDSTLVGTVEKLHRDAPVRKALNAYATAVLSGQATRPALLPKAAPDQPMSDETICPAMSESLM